MNIPQIILVIVAVAAAFGATAAYFSRSQGTNTIRLLQQNIEAYKDAEKMKDERIKYLEGQIYSKDQTIAKLSGKK